MEFTIERSLFTDAMKSVQGAVERRNTMPILSNVYLSAEKNQVTLITTDMDVGIRVSLAADVKKTGTFTLGAKKLLELVQQPAGDKVTVKLQDNNRCQITVGRFQPTMYGLPGEDFPPLAPIDKGQFFTFDSQMLLDMIDKTVFAASSDESRIALNGVYVERSPKNDGMLRMVATDGHRLTLVEREIESAKEAIGQSGVIIHRKSVQELRKLCERAPKVELSIQKSHVVAKADGTVLVMRLVDAEFPRYANVIPQKSDRIMKVNRSDFLGALQRASILADERTHLVKLKLDKGELTTECSNQSQGETTEKLSCDYNSAPLLVGFNVLYLIAAIDHTSGDEIEIAVIDEINPATISGADDTNYLNVIMPMRI
ncbi:MAG: DNA polymerase III subunit beta [Deltaproteobacteria bacterium]|nr:DNA polymerase III subunit beta [Deltaproteobacteria bacterium]